MQDLLVHLKIPIPSQPVVGVPALIFSHWLPIGDDYAIVLQHEEIEVRLWFDVKSTWWASQPTEEEIERTRNVAAHRMYADVIVEGISDDLIDYIRRKDHREKVATEDQYVQEQYDDLAWRILSRVMPSVNRMLSYAKSRWGQYWLSQYQVDRGNMYGRFTEFEAKATVDRVQWYRFSPSAVITTTATLMEEDRFIQRDQWDEVCEFVASERQPPLSRALLAGAELLAATGYDRSALTEAVTALEVAIFRFAEDPEMDSTLGPRFTNRVDLRSLAAHVDRLGLTGTVHYLLPILLPESVLPGEVLAECREAIMQRQNVVHRGQRTVREDSLQASLRAIRKMCDSLELLTRYPETAVSSYDRDES